MSSLAGVKRPWLDEPLRSSAGPQSEGPEDLSTNSERSSFSVSPSPSEVATVPEILSSPCDLSTKRQRQRLSSVSSEGSPRFRLPSAPLIPPIIAPLLDHWNPLLYPLPALYYTSLCANLSAHTFRPQILTHDKPQEAVVPSWKAVKQEPREGPPHPPHPPPPPAAASNRFTCDDCQKSYSTFAGLSRHKEFHCVNVAAGRKEFNCKYCPKAYVSMGALKMHIRTHTLPCKCDICGKAFSRPWLLQGHIRTHTGEKPFECEHCHRAFADRSNLRAHLQTHQEVKKYSCARCSKTFSRMSLLQKHQDSVTCPGVR